jgi:RNA polymerase sigma factor (sigma-70 family)
MPTDRGKSAVASLRQALFVRECGGLGDGELLGRFLAQRDEAAFAALVRRHGPMVLGVCRRVLGHAQDAEDAFQATFLVLVRNAASIRKQESVGNWLYGVAYRTALEARSAAARRHAAERQVKRMPEPTVGPAEVGDDLRPILDAELSRLPDRYRAAVVLCDLEGRPRREAARVLGIPEGTLSSRLAAGRRRLAGRLARRGITLSAGALAAGLGLRTACAAVPAQLVQATVASALAFTAALPAAAGTSATILALTERVVRAMLLTRVKLAFVLLLALAFLGTGAGMLWTGAAAREPGAAAQEDGPAKGPAEHPDKDAGLQAREPGERQEVWTLDFHFKDPRLLTVELPPLHQQVVVWYLQYNVANDTREAHTFVPEFELVTADKNSAHRDHVLPKVEEAIRKAEDPTGLLKIHSSASIAAEPIPPARPGAKPEAVHGVAVWDGVHPDADGFTVFVSGLSNAWSVTEPAPPDTKPVLRRKTLQLNFKRVRDRMEFVPPARWVYRTAPVQPALDVATKQLAATERQRDFLEKQLAIVVQERDDLRKQVATLREQLAPGKKMGPAVTPQETAKSEDRLEVVQGLQRQLAELKAKERDRRIYVEFLIRRVRSLRPPAGEDDATDIEAERRRERFRMMRIALEHQLQSGDEEEAERDLQLEQLISQLITLYDLPPVKGEPRRVVDQIEAVLAAAETARKTWKKERDEVRKEVESLRKDLGERP